MVLVVQLRVPAPNMQDKVLQRPRDGRKDVNKEGQELLLRVWPGARAMLGTAGLPRCGRPRRHQSGNSRWREGCFHVLSSLEFKI